MIPYSTVSHDIRVTVRPVYLDGQSDVLGKRFVFGYHVRIGNESLDDVQLLRRHWIITDATGRVKEVEGEGVIGRQPVIAPGMAHEYNSYSVIETFTGIMEGSYIMERGRGERFRVAIPKFNLQAAAN